jgi:colicin import membrane protein
MTRKISEKGTQKQPSRPSPKTMEMESEALLSQRLAALKARAEERKLAEKIAALKKRVGEGGGVSLSGGGLSQELLNRLALHLKSFWAVP